MIKHLANLYFNIKPFEQNGLIYNRLGIKGYQQWLRRVARRHLNPLTYYLKDYSLNTLHQFEHQSKLNEAVHILLAFILLIFKVSLIVDYRDLTDLLFIILFMTLNIAVNIYPIFLQRYNRARIQGIKARKLQKRA